MATTDPNRSEREMENNAKVRAFASECVVLLENRNNTLPLKTVGRIALFGNGVRHTVKGGTGSGDVNTRDNVTVEQAFFENGFRITTEGWLGEMDDLYNQTLSSYHAQAQKWAIENNSNPFFYEFGHPMVSPAVPNILEEDCQDADTAVYVLSRNSGEGGDRDNKKGDYRLRNAEIGAIRDMAQNFKNSVLVLNTGGIVDLSEVLEIEELGAIVLMSQLGAQGGRVLCDVLLGRVNPSGKLTDTWAKSYEDYPSSKYFRDDSARDDDYYTDGIYVGYRYFDTFGKDVLYPFGYGLSYTDFHMEIVQSKLENNILRVWVRVKNTGNLPGKEVIQFYVTPPSGNVMKAYQSLKGFIKTKHLIPNESEMLQVEFDVASFASYDTSLSCWILESGDYILRAGNSSRNTSVVCAVRVKREVIVEQCRELMGYGGDVKEICGGFGISEDTSSYTIHELPLDAVETKINRYFEIPVRPVTTEVTEHVTIDDVRNGKYTLEDLTAQLSPEELMRLCIGHFSDGATQVVGDAAVTVPGAAGETSHVPADRGLTPQILADGPAGLRLTTSFERDGETYYQYATSIPIATALAQSWNLELIMAIGQMVGQEMQEFGVKLWLAPGMNIHRNPLCGRNFEYYSEDPYLTGYCASAMTLGVQSVEGKGTTIKHFAANNREENRMFVSAHISEQALREIYLKGFELAVKISKPLSVMTSYNLINGVHSANNYDLITDILRNEWGFEGMVMTDWLTCSSRSEDFSPRDKRYSKSSAARCIAAGNDLIMPGGEQEYRELVSSYQLTDPRTAGVATLRGLQECAMRVLRLQL